MNRDRYWRVMLPIFAGSTRIRDAMAAVRRGVISALSLVERQTIDELASRVERIEGQIARRQR